MAKQVWTATGRRKRSSASVRLVVGTGNITVNGVSAVNGNRINRKIHRY